MSNYLITSLTKKKSIGIKSLAILIDPDHLKVKNLEKILLEAQKCQVDYFFVGGSLILQDRLEESIKLIRELTKTPIILFPGSGFQISQQADALLFLSLVSGRNADFLIGKQVEIAPKLYHTKLEIIPTAYLLIDGKQSNTAAYISQTQPIPRDKPEIAVATVLAAQFLGMKLVYLDAGSGALALVSEEMISKVSNVIDVPLIVGGGIKDGLSATKVLNSGADLIVVGNAIEENPKLIQEMSYAVHGGNPVELMMN